MKYNCTVSSVTYGQWVGVKPFMFNNLAKAHRYRVFLIQLCSWA